MTGLSMGGRCSRKRFFWTTIAISLAGNVAAIAGEIALGETRFEPFIAQFVILAVLLVSIVMISILTVKRLHDLNRSLAHLFRLAIPVYNIYLVYILFFRKGTEGDNRYGADPLAREQKQHGEVVSDMGANARQHVPREATDEGNSASESTATQHSADQLPRHITLFARSCQVFGLLVLVFGAVSFLPGSTVVDFAPFGSAPLSLIVAAAGLYVFSPLTLITAVASALRIRFSKRRLKGGRQVWLGIGFAVMGWATGVVGIVSKYGRLW